MSNFTPEDSTHLDQDAAEKKPVEQQDTNAGTPKNNEGADIPLDDLGDKPGSGSDGAKTDASSKVTGDGGTINHGYIGAFTQHFHGTTDTEDQINLDKQDPQCYAKPQKEPWGAEALWSRLQAQRALVLVGPDRGFVEGFLRLTYDSLGATAQLWHLSEDDLKARRLPSTSVLKILARFLNDKQGTHLIFTWVSNEATLLAAKSHLSRDPKEIQDKLAGLRAYLIFLVAEPTYSLPLSNYCNGSPEMELKLSEYRPWNLLWKENPIKVQMEDLNHQYEEGVWGETLMAAFSILRRVGASGDIHLEAAILGKSEDGTTKVQEERDVLVNAIRASLENEENILERIILFLMIESESLSAQAFRYLVEALLEGAEPEMPPLLAEPVKNAEQAQSNGEGTSPPPPPVQPIKKSPLAEFKTSIDRIRRKLGLTVEGGRIQFRRLVVNADIFRDLREDHYFYFEVQYHNLAQRQIFFDPEAPQEVIDFVMGTLVSDNNGASEDAVISLITKLAIRIKWLGQLHGELLQLEGSDKIQEASLWSQLHLKAMEKVTADDTVGNRLRSYLFGSMRSAMVAKSKLVHELRDNLIQRAYSILMRCIGAKSTAVWLLRLLEEHRRFVGDMIRACIQDQNINYDRDADWMALLRRFVSIEGRNQSALGAGYWMLLRMVEMADDRQLVAIEEILTWTDTGVIKSLFLYDYSCLSFSFLRINEIDGNKVYRIDKYPLLRSVCRSSDWKANLQELVMIMLKQDGHQFHFEQHYCKYDHIDHPADLLEKWSLILQEDSEKHEWYLECLRSHVIRDRHTDHLFARKELLRWWSEVKRNSYFERYEAATAPQNRAMLKQRRETCAMLIKNLNSQSQNSQQQ